MHISRPMYRDFCILQTTPAQIQLKQVDHKAILESRGHLGEFKLANTLDCEVTIGSHDAASTFVGP